MRPRQWGQCVLALLALTLEASPLHAAYGFRKLLTVDNARVAGAANHLNFPVLVSLASDSDLQANIVSPQGLDIQFRASDGVRILDHEIERYDAGTGTLVAWVRLPVLDFDDDTSFYIYYGDASISCASGNPEGVWDSSFKGVWHLEEDVTDELTTGVHDDSTSNGNDGAQNGNVETAGAVAEGQDFDGTDDFIDIGNVIGTAGSVTLSAWIQHDNVTSVRDRYVELGNDVVIRHDGVNSVGQLHFYVRTDGAARHLRADGVLSNGVWYHVAGTWDGTTQRLFLNGVELDSQSPGGSLDAFSGGSIADNDPTETMDGVIDEVRISDTARSADWIATEYNNQSQPTKAAGCLDAGFVCVGTEQTLGAAWTNVSVASGLATSGNKDGGVSWGDFNDDGCLDVLVNTNDGTLDTRLYMQDVAGSCAGTFTDVTACLVPGMTAATERSVLWADFNNDGHLDFARTTTHLLEVYLNNGASPAAGCGPAWSVFGIAGGPNVSFDPGNIEGMGAIDYDNDADLDLFLQNTDGSAVSVYANDGSGLFADPPAVVAGPTFVVGDFAATGDLDVDGDVDVVLRLGSGHPDVWANTGGSFVAGTFDENADNANKGGVASCDLDDDGDFDLIWTDNGTNQAWRNNGGTDAAVTWTAMGALPVAGNIDGVACGDVDNDGDLDLALTSSGNDHLLRNDGAFTFVDVSPASFGTNDGEGTAFADYDRDGDVDLLINQDGANELWRNERDDNNYLVVRALQDVGGGATRDAIGATLRLLDCSLSPVSGVREVNGGRGHGSQDPAYVHFGLPSCGATSGPNAAYVVEAAFLDGSVVQKAVVPSLVSGYQLVSLTSTDANDLLFCTTAVDLVSFEATPLDGAVELQWETGSELDNLGFHLYRSSHEDGPFEPLTTSPVPGLGSSPEGARYRYLDSGLDNGATYHYLLEDVETTGRTTRHGPVLATPGAGLGDVERGTEVEGELPASVSFGTGVAPEMTVARRGPRHVVLELETLGFEAVPQEDGSVRLRVEGLESDETPLALPVKRYWLPIPPGVEAEVLATTASRVSRFRGLRPASWEDSEIFMTSAGTVVERRRRKRERAREPAPEAARIVTTAYQGAGKKVLLELSPLRWDEATEELWLARELTVRLRLKPSLSREVRRHRLGAGVLAQLATASDGLHAVGFEELFLHQRRGVETRRLRLGRRGEPVAFHVAPDPDRFGPGSTLYFVSGGEGVYELEVAAEGERMPMVAAAPKGAPTPFYLHRIEEERERLYQAALLEREDPWLWELVMAGETKRFDFEVSALAMAAVPARLSVRLQGGSDLPASPDHHVRVSMNGVVVGEARWNAKLAAVVEAEVPPGVLHDGDNALEVENVGDTGAAYSMVFLDEFSVEYPRRPVAEDGQLDGRWSVSGTAAIAGVGAAALVLDTTGAVPRWLTAVERSDDGVRFGAESGRNYLVARAPRSVAVRRPLPSDLASTERQADYVVIAPEAFRPAAEPLLEHRRGQRLTATFAPVEEIFSAFGHGERRPEAIRDFLSHAYHEWRKPAPRYVVLLGDGTYDLDDVYGLGLEHDRLPPMTIRTRFLRTASDPALASVHGEDLLPDLAIGRLPAATLAEARTMVAKILAYERGALGLDGPVLLVADDADVAGDFAADGAKLASGVLGGRDVTTIALERLGAPATRSAIRRGFDDGAAIVSYLGHGGIHLWASENLFDVAAVGKLAEQPRQPIVLTMNCLNGYFHFPFFDALGEALVKADGRGAIAAFSPSGLSLHEPAHRYQEALLDALLHGGHDRLGDAVLAAQTKVVDEGALPELVAIYHLFGDPALTLR